ncbi:hypothetical protein [Streptosporangium amethystogenes]|nr:hypothetical protein [Streptosporangium amethystogenes]
MSTKPGQLQTFVRAGLEVFIPMSKIDQDAAGTTIAILCGSHLDT